MQVPGGKAGCRWKSPAWYPSLDSAPQVNITCANTQIHKYTNTQIHKYTNQHKYTNTQIRKYTNTQIHKYANTQIHKYTNHPFHQVEISEDRLVTISWTEQQLMENRACTDLFEVTRFHFNFWSLITKN